MFGESEERPRVKMRKGLGCEAVWQLKGFQAEEQDEPSPHNISLRVYVKVF